MRVSVVIVLALMLAACQPPHQTEPPNTLAARSAVADRAADKLVAMARGSETSGIAPRQADPVAGPLLDQVFDMSALPTLPRDVADLPPMNRWGAAMMKVGQVYVLAGTGFTDASNATTDAAAAQSLRNTITYAPELGRFFDAQAVLLSTECASLYYLQVAHPSAADADQRAAMMQDLQYKIEKDYSNEIGFMLNSGPTDAWKAARIKVLATEAPRISSLLLPNNWGHLQRQARQVAAQSADPALKAELELFATRIEPPGG
jgi:hypothetical protein